MINCPKCQSMRVSGPKYRIGGARPEFPTSEALVYTCLNCGYEQVEMTAEQKLLQEKMQAHLSREKHLEGR